MIQNTAPAVTCRHHEVAARAFAKATQLNSDWAAPCFGLATTLHKLGREDAAITGHHSDLALEPNQVEAQLLERKGHASDTAAHYNISSLHRLNLPVPHVHRSALYEVRGEFEDALWAYDLSFTRHGHTGGLLAQRLFSLLIEPG